MDNTLAVKADHVSMHFNMATEKVDSLRDYLTRMMTKNLFYKDFIAVDQVSFEVKKGEVFGIVGTNGSGKSTLLKMIAGVLEPTSGTIEIDGKMAPLIELGAGFDGELTGRENIYLNGALLGYSKEFLDEKFQSIVDFAEIWEFLDTPLKNYSSGMTARIAFGIATAVVPDILIADEILAVGDFLFQQKCEQRIRELMERGTTILIVSHSIDQIENLCDRALWIEKSKPIMLGKAKNVCTAYRNIRAEESDEKKKVYQVVAQEKCCACGETIPFRDEPGMTYKTEAFCTVCGTRKRSNDLMKFYMESEFGIQDGSLDQIADELRKKVIVDCGDDAALSKKLSEYPFYMGHNWQGIQDKLETLESSSFPEHNNIDLVILQRFLAFVDNPLDLLRRFAAHMSKGGCLLINVPYFETKLTCSPLQEEMILLDDIPMKTEWGQDLEHILSETGFEVSIKKMHEWYSLEEITDLANSMDRINEGDPYYYLRNNSWAIIAKKR